MKGLSLSEIYKKKILNQVLSIQEFKEGKLIVKSRPSKAIVELTENCNFSCIMCMQAFDPKYDKYNPKYNMSLEMFEKVAEALFDTTYFVDLRGFGESVIIPYWPEILNKINQYPLINWHLVTNLSLPKDEIWDRMVQNGFILGISFDASTKETFETIRKRSRFEVILHNLEVLQTSRKTHQKGFDYFIVTVQKKNIFELKGIVEIAAKYGVSEVQFKMVRQFDGPIHHQEMIPEGSYSDLKHEIEQALDLGINTGVRVTVNDEEMCRGISTELLQKAQATPAKQYKLNFSPPDDVENEFLNKYPWSKIDSEVLSTFKVAKNQKCFKPFYFTYITPDGKVSTCNHMMNPDIFEVGNLNYQDFDEIWNSSEYQTFRKSLITARPIDPRCQWCLKHRVED